MKTATKTWGNDCNYEEDASLSYAPQQYLHPVTTTQRRAFLQSYFHMLTTNRLLTSSRGRRGLPGVCWASAPLRVTLRSHRVSGTCVPAWCVPSCLLELNVGKTRETVPGAPDLV